MTKYNPPEPLVEQLVREKTPRQLAVAYLRATRRARNAETALDVHGALDDALNALQYGNGSKAVEALKAACAKMRSHKEASE